MQSNRPDRGECLILPVQGQPIVTTYQATRLYLPNELPTRRQAWRPLVIAMFAFALWLTPTPTRAAVTTDEMFQLTNLERSAVGTGPLRRHPLLDHAAGLKLQDMIDQQYFDHQSPTGQRGWFWMEQVGYGFTEAGENLAMDFTDGVDVINAWLESSSHRQNILSGKFTDVGVAVAVGTLHGKTTTLVVELFGRQTSLTATSSQPTPLPVNPPAPVKLPAVEAISPVATPIRTDQTVPSLVEPAGVPAPTLVFTLADPDPTAKVPDSPAEVLGLSTELLPRTPQSGEPVTLLGWLILSALGVAAASIGLATRWWPSVYPQPIRIIQAIEI